MRVEVVYEYGKPNADWMMTSLVESLRSRIPDFRPSYVYGIFSHYRPGGLKVERLVNLIWIYAWVAIRLLIFNPDAVLVRTAPPGIQLWTVFWARFRRIPVFCWLMDYHPELEARQLDLRGLHRISRFLRTVDANLMPRFAAIIALDAAMAGFARARSGDVEVLEHPTWGAPGSVTCSPVPFRPNAKEGPLCLAYSGNLGTAHNLNTFAELLENLTRKRRVQLFVIGASKEGEKLFFELGAALGIATEVHPRVPFVQLQELYCRWQIDAGVVLLTDQSVGLVSPSKFSGYINFKIPIIYVGPAGTNTAEVCSRFGGGFWIENDASGERIQAVSDALLDKRNLALAAEGAGKAATHFARLNEDSLADLIAHRIQNSVAAKCRKPAVVNSKS